MLNAVEFFLPELVKKFSAFYGTHKFITVLTKAPQLYAFQIQIRLSHLLRASSDTVDLSGRAV
jgi:hypothetical protein